MRYIIITIIVLVLIPISISVDFSKDEASEYSGVNIFVDHTNNTCRWSREGVADVSITVNYIAPSDEVDYYGRWIPDDNLIVLNNEIGLNVDTIAHEVYHAVETMMARNGVADPHWGAYLQGGLTECVFQLVLKDNQ